MAKDRIELRFPSTVPPDEITLEEFTRLSELVGEPSQSRLIRRALKVYLTNYAEMEITALEERIASLRKLTEDKP